MTTVDEDGGVVISDSSSRRPPLKEGTSLNTEVVCAGAALQPLRTFTTQAPGTGHNWTHHRGNS